MPQDIGFSGTRDGMTMCQKNTVKTLLLELCHLAEGRKFNQARHGVCIGADEDFHIIVRSLGEGVYVIGHPGQNKNGRCPTRSPAQCDLMLPEEQFVVRDHRIVDQSQVMVFCPRGPEELRSGTWASIRYARQQDKWLFIVWPSGELTEENKV